MASTLGGLNGAVLLRGLPQESMQFGAQYPCETEVRRFSDGCFSSCTAQEHPRTPGVEVKEKRRKGGAWGWGGVGVGGGGG